MPSIINLSPIWEHTLTEILNHGNKTEMGMGIIMRSWVNHNNLEDMSDLLIYDLNDFTPGGTLCRYKQTAEAEETKLMLNTPLKELYNLYRYIQHLILESEFDYDDDEFDDPLDKGNWLLQTRGKYMKLLYIIPPLQQNQETHPIKNLLVSERVSKEKKLLTLHSKMKDTLTALAGVYTSQLNHMNVKMYLILSTHHPILKKNYLRQNKFSCFLYWINIY